MGALTTVLITVVSLVIVFLAVLLIRAIVRGKSESSKKLLLAIGALYATAAVAALLLSLLNF
ncbi:MAG: hypothetical protein ACYC99_04285 [Candidatus Geothermincolia bacterium]